MKTRTLQFLLSLIFLAISSITFAQTDTTIILNPDNFVPHEDGYYVSGADVDKVGNDGIPEHYDGCEDAYGDASHNETGIQNGWTYENVIIFNDCQDDEISVAAGSTIKGTQPVSDWPTSESIIQITKLKKLDSADMTFGYIQSPAFSNIKSLTVKASTDVSINGGRDIFFLIEISRDGQVWSYLDYSEIPGGDALADAFIIQKMTNQGGDIHTYTSGNSDFDAIKAISESADSIMLRIVSFPDLDRSKIDGERLKIWEMTIEAQTVVPSSGGPGDTTALATSVDLTQAPYRIVNGEFESLCNEKLYVYRLSGALVGTGNNVKIPSSKGLFIIKTESGFAEKVFIK